MTPVSIVSVHQRHIDPLLMVPQAVFAQQGIPAKQEPANLQSVRREHMLVRVVSISVKFAQQAILADLVL